MHFFWIYHWMKQLGIKPGTMDMVFDCDDMKTCVGSFGMGLAQGLMKNVMWLPNVEVCTAVCPVKGDLTNQYPHAPGTSNRKEYPR